MDMNRFTVKSIESIQQAETIAMRFQNTEIDIEHLVLALVAHSDGLISRLLQRMDISLSDFQTYVQQSVEKKPRVSGPGREFGKVYISRVVNQILLHADEEAKQMKDEYVSVEHLFLAILKEVDKTSLKDIFGRYRLTRTRFLQSLSGVRGNRRVTSETPESTYEVLEKMEWT